jgi:hypothetical protein
MTSTPTFNDNLDPALMVAPQEFIKWSRTQLLAEQQASTPTEPLYHYTDETALRGILAKQRTWCFSHEQQTDKTEFEYALAKARDVIREVGQSDDFFTRSFCACLDDMLSVNKLSGPFEFYLFSVSRHRDHGPQWKEYGRGGHGFAIGLSPTLFLPDKDDLYDEANKNLHIGRVIYGDDPTTDRHRLAIDRAAEITSRVGKANATLVGAAPPSRYLEVMAHELLASQLIWNCLTAKEDRYADEREVRGIIMNVRAKFDQWRRNFRGRAYIEHELPLKAPGSIVEILVGPKANPNAEAVIADFLKAEGYNYPIPIVRSTTLVP